MAGTPGLVWVGPVFDPSGYADEGRGMLCALERTGVPVSLRPVQRVSHGFREGLPATERALLDRQIARPLPDQRILVQHSTAEGFQVPPNAPYLVGRTMFETHLIPPTWVSRCNAMDELWIPSQFNIDTFRRAGVRVPMHLVPGGIDTTSFHPDVDPLPIPGLRGTVFLSVFEWRRGKGWDVLLRAWAEAFAADADVTLVLRTYPIGNADGRDNATVINERIDNFLRDSCDGRSRGDVAPIVVLGDKVPASKMAALYTAAHAYVAPTRGEGWGRPFMEASACGVPVIATRWSAHLEFLNDANSYLVDIDGLSPADCSDVPNYEGQLWAEPNVAHLRTLLQRVHEDRAESQLIGRRARMDMAREWPWSRAASAIATRVRAIGQHRTFGTATRPAVSPRHRVVIDAPLFGESRWHETREALMAAFASDPHMSVEVRNRQRRPIRPSWGLASSVLWHPESPARPSPDATDEIRLTWLDGASAQEFPDPPRGRWILHTGDTVSNCVPGPLVRRLRDLADEVWVPDQSAYDACLRIGIDATRLWRVPALRESDRCTPEGPQIPLGDTAGTVYMTMLTSAAQAPGIERMLRLWDRTFGPDDDVLMVLLLPPALDSETIRVRDRLLADIVSGRLRPRSRFRIDTTTRDLDTLPSVLRSADILVDPSGGPESTALWQIALSCGVPVMTARSSESELQLGDDAGWLVTAHSDRPLEMAVAPLQAALQSSMREGDDRAERERRRERARTRAAQTPFVTEVAAEAIRRVGALRSRGPTCAVDENGATDMFPLSEARPLVILVHGDWHDGSCAGVVRSYAETFDVQAPITLAVCLDPAQGVTMADAHRRIEQAFAAAGVDPSEAPHVMLIPDVIDDPVRASLLARSDAVVIVNDAPLSRAARTRAVPVIDVLTRAMWHARLAPLLTALVPA